MTVPFKTITIKDAVLEYRNFQGLPIGWNPAGKRNFCLVLDAEKASQMIEDGWNVGFAKDKEALLKVTVEPDFVVADEFRMDNSPLSNVEVTLVQVRYEFRGRTGTVAFLTSIKADF